MKLSSLSSRRQYNLSPSTSTSATYITSLLLHDLDSDGVLELVSLSREGVLSIFRLDHDALETSSVLKPLLPLYSCVNLGTLMDVALDGNAMLYTPIHMHCLLTLPPPPQSNIPAVS